MRAQSDLRVFEQALIARLTYDPVEGSLRWNMPKREDFATLNAFTSWRTRFGGAVAGKIRPDGYIAVRVTVAGRTDVFLAHRVAWLLHYGEWPDGQIDHINGNRRDNRISNLRAVSQHANLMNVKCPVTSQTGVPGVTWSKHAKRWIVRININKRTKNLGYYLDFNEAVKIRRAAEREHGYFHGHGKRGGPCEDAVRTYVQKQVRQRVRHAPA